MGWLDFIKPEDRNRWIAIIIFALFMLSTAAYYIGYSRSGGTTPSTSTGGSLNALDNFNGTGEANATWVSWDASLLVVGNSTAAEALISKWKNAGLVVADEQRADGRLLRLADAGQVFNVSRQLIQSNVSVYADGTMMIPSAQVNDGQGASRTVGGNTFQYRTVPIFEPGDHFSLSFNAQVQNGQLVALGSLLIGSTPGLLSLVAPLNASLNSTFFRVDIPWAERNLYLSQFQSDLPEGSRISYRPRSWVRLPGATSAQLQALNDRKLIWVLQVEAAGSDGVPIVSVAPNFIDAPHTTSDLAPFNLTPDLPTSPLDIYLAPSAWEGSDRSQKLLALWKADMPNETVPVFTPTYHLNVRLPPVVQAEGGEYVVTNQSMGMNSLYPPSPEGKVYIKFTAIGRRIANYDAAEYLVPNAGNQTGGTLNVTANSTAGSNPAGGNPAANSSAAGTNASASGG